MTINLRKCNFSELIDFITSINGELYNASIETIVNKIYNDTWDYNRYKKSDTMFSICGVRIIISLAMVDDIPDNTEIKLYYDKHSSDCYLFITIGENETLVLSLEKSIYLRKLQDWLLNNGLYITTDIQILYQLESYEIEQHYKK